MVIKTELDFSVVNVYQSRNKLWNEIQEKCLLSVQIYGLRKTTYYSVNDLKTCSRYSVRCPKSSQILCLL